MQRAHPRTHARTHTRPPPLPLQELAGSAGDLSAGDAAALLVAAAQLPAESRPPQPHALALAGAAERVDGAHYDPRQAARLLSAAHGLGIHKALPARWSQPLWKAVAAGAAEAEAEGKARAAADAAAVAAAPAGAGAAAAAAPAPPGAARPRRRRAREGAERALTAEAAAEALPAAAAGGARRRALAARLMGIVSSDAYLIDSPRCLVSALRGAAAAAEPPGEAFGEALARRVRAAGRRAGGAPKWAACRARRVRAHGHVCACTHLNSAVHN